jgi:hypothetical protein
MKIKSQHNTNDAQFSLSNAKYFLRNLSENLNEEMNINGSFLGKKISNFQQIDNKRQLKRVLSNPLEYFS